MTLEFQDFYNELSQYSSYALTAPGGADGDSVGTQCALAEYLKTVFPNKPVYIVNEEECPKRYLFLKGTDQFLTAKEFIQKEISIPECWICVDGGPNRLGELTTRLWLKAKARGQIDHHVIRQAYESVTFDINNSNEAATTSILFKFLEQQSFSLTASIAQALYTGLIYDTGLFKHSNTTPDVMRIGAKLLEHNFNHTETAEKTLLVRTQKNLKMLEKLLQKIHFEHNSEFVWASLSQSDFIDAQAGPDDKDGLIETLFLTPKCQVACLFYESEPNTWKLSLRAKKADVAHVARTLDKNGGGHKLAAGCTLEGNEASVIEKAKKEILQSIQHLS